MQKPFSTMKKNGVFPKGQLFVTFEIKPVVDMQNYFFKNPEIQHVDVAAVAGDIVSEMWFGDVWSLFAIAILKNNAYFAMCPKTINDEFPWVYHP